MVCNCSGTRSSDAGCMRSFALCMPLMVLMALALISGSCVFFPECTKLSVLPEVSDIIAISEPTAQESTYDEDEDDEPDIVVQFRTVRSPERSLLQSHSRVVSTDHAELAASEQTQRDAAQARCNKKCVKRTLSSRFDKWTHRHIGAAPGAPVVNRDAARVDHCSGGSVANGGDDSDEEGSGLRVLSEEVTVHEEGSGLRVLSEEVTVQEWPI
jgi:hypothetical protein